MIQLAVALVVGAAAVAIAWYLQRRSAPAPERGSSWTVPELVSRTDFERPDAPWLVVLFSSSTCLACRGTAAKAELLASDEVAYQEVDHVERRDLHDRYGVDAVTLIMYRMLFALPMFAVRQTWQAQFMTVGGAPTVPA